MLWSKGHEKILSIKNTLLCLLQFNQILYYLLSTPRLKHPTAFPLHYQAHYALHKLRSSNFNINTIVDRQDSNQSPKKQNKNFANLSECISSIYNDYKAYLHIYHLHKYYKTQGVLEKVKLYPKNEYKALKCLFTT